MTQKLIAFKFNTGFPVKSKLKLHVDTVHERKKPYKCETCNKYFSEKIKKKNHIASVHEGQKPYKYDRCNAGFS